MAKVLVIEDEKTLQGAITKTLAKRGIESYTATSSKEALSHLKTRNDISAIWLDHYLLGEETGLDFLKKIRENKKWHNIPVFVITNSIADEKLRNYHKLGVENYYVKSDTSIHKIIDSISSILKGE